MPRVTPPDSYMYLLEVGCSGCIFPLVRLGRGPQQHHDEEDATFTLAGNHHARVGHCYDTHGYCHFVWWTLGCSYGTRYCGRWFVPWCHLLYHHVVSETRVWASHGHIFLCCYPRWGFRRVAREGHYGDEWCWWKTWLGLDIHSRGFGNCPCGMHCLLGHQRLPRNVGSYH